MNESAEALLNVSSSGVAFGKEPHLIIITGSITARPGSLEELEAISLAHVERSRLEPGCLSHGVHRDVENPLRLVFFERWLDQPSVDAHFAVASSGEFVRQAMALSDSPPTLELFDVVARE